MVARCEGVKVAGPSSVPCHTPFLPDTASYAVEAGDAIAGLPAWLKAPPEPKTAAAARSLGTARPMAMIASGRARQGRRHHLQRARAPFDQGQGVAKPAAHATDFARAAAGHHEQDGRVREAPLGLLRVGPQAGDLLAERMAHKRAGRPAKALH